MLGSLLTEKKKKNPCGTTCVDHLIRTENYRVHISKLVVLHLKKRRILAAAAPAPKDTQAA